MDQRNLIEVLLIFGLIQFVVTDYTEHPDLKRQYKFHYEPKTWHEARIACRLEDAELAMPMTAEEAIAMTAIFEQYPARLLKCSRPNHMLLNFHDQFEQGEFVMDNGDSIQYGYHTWTKGSPNMDGERCGSMDRLGDLDDFPCDVKATFLCQKGLGIQSVVPEVTCPTHDPAYREFKGKCYKFHIDPKTWPQARTICHAEGGFLTVIKNEEEERHLVELINKAENRVTHVDDTCCALIGFHDRFKEGYFLSVTGKTFGDVGYVHWHKGQPDNARGKEDCGSLHREGGMNDIKCDRPFPFICELSTMTLDTRFYRHH